MLQNSYSPAFPLKHQQKDMRLALALGDENAVSMPIAAAANEVKLFFSFCGKKKKKWEMQPFYFLYYAFMFKDYHV